MHIKKAKFISINMTEINFETIEFSKNVCIKDLTTIKTNAYVKGIFYPKNKAEFVFIYNYLKINNIRFEILGNGSNVLFPNKNNDILLISTQKMQQICKKYKNFVKFSSNMTLSQIFEFCKKHNLGGFEKIATIPGTLGGSLKINAGCFNDKIFDNLISVEILKNGKVINIKKENILYGYRFTNLQDCAILSAKFSLPCVEKSDLIKTNINTLLLRASKQPKGFSMGSVFKNPPGYSAGFLIEQCGLKGYRKNDAYFSEVHSNFIINEQNASGDDIMFLINLAKTEVKEKFNIDLELEIFLIRDSSFHSE